MATRYEHYITDATGSDGVATYWQAQTFTPQSNHTITHLTLRVYKLGSPGDLTVTIRNTYANWPDDTILASATVPAASIPQQAGAAINAPGIVVALDVPLDVIALTKYAIVLHKGGDSSNQYRWVKAFPGYYGEESYLLGTRCYSYSGGGYENWTAIGNEDFMFEEWNGEPSPSSVTTQAVSDILHLTATGNGNITSLGDSAYVYQYGHCWGESENPTVGSQNTVWKGAAPGVGAFTSDITGLSPETTYHCRAFTVGMAGTVYGADVEFTTPAPYHYIIYNVDDLQAMENDLIGYYEVANDIDASATIDWNAGAGFLPIGQAANFIGRLDGKGYTISGLFINGTSNNQALFDTIDGGAVLQNIKMTGVDITITDSYYAAALVAKMFGSCTVENCSSAGSVTATGTGGYAAGLIAIIYSGTVSGCYSTCTVTISGSRDYAGGFVAYASGGTINDCYARGAVTVGDDYGGGFVGYNSGAIIENCYSTGLLAVVDRYEGGFCGYNYGTHTNCFWDTETSGTSTDPGGGSGGATGKTTAEMKTKSTFTDAGWDFTTPIWYINRTINDGYPAFIGVVTRIKGNPNVDQRIYQHVERMGR
ncbi:hypothetical protein ES703_40922 [subsurface metagenome]